MWPHLVHAKAHQATPLVEERWARRRRLRRSWCRPAALTDRRDTGGFQVGSGAYEPHGVTPSAASIQGDVDAHFDDELRLDEVDVESLCAALARREPTPCPRVPASLLLKQASYAGSELPVEGRGAANEVQTALGIESAEQQTGRRRDTSGHRTDDRVARMADTLVDCRFIRGLQYSP